MVWQNFMKLFEYIGNQQQGPEPPASAEKPAAWPAVLAAAARLLVDWQDTAYSISIYPISRPRLTSDLRC